MLVLLIFIGVTATMSFNARSQASMTTGVKLQQFYQSAAASAMARTRANLADHWITPDGVLGEDECQNWRFGQLLKTASEEVTVSESVSLAAISATVTESTETESSGDTYGALMEEDQWGNSIEMNAGLLSLTYKVWVQNNPDDPAFFLTGVESPACDGTIDSTWDLDGKVVLTVEVFGADDTIPLATQSALIGLVGADYDKRHDDNVFEGDAFGADNRGTGDKGSAARISIEALEEGS
jgi:hypothetical protein